MAQFKVAEITESIITGVTRSLAKIILPKVRKMVREEIDKGMKDIMLEVIKSQGPGQIPIQENGVTSSTKTAKASITQRQQRTRDRAKALVERSGIDDPLLDMVVNAEDMQEEQQLQMESRLSEPMVDSKDVQPGNGVSDPSLINFEDRLEKLGIG